MSSIAKSILLILMTLLVSCWQQKEQKEQKFNKEIWNEIDGSYNIREPMVNDVMENHLYIGMKYADVINLLGDSTTKMDKNHKIYYEVYYDFHTELNKGLSIQFTKDSLVKSFKKVEWTN
ncbi:hypothetical protein [Fluviicola taffensis]|uniref:hypothetical protein n=1 Tax=Fluviicola taffensis TaxID=191579 RepID=UPI0031381DFD